MPLNEISVTLAGNLTRDPELRFTPAGLAVASFNVACNSRIRQGDGTYTDGETVFYRCTAWRDLGENLCASLRKGDPVIIVGRIRRRTWEDRETGAARFADEITCDTVAVPMDRRTLKLTKVTREHAGEGQGNGDPWASEPASGSESGSESGAAAAAESPQSSRTGRDRKS